MLGHEVGSGVLSRSKGGAVDQSPKLPVAVNQRILHCRQLLIEPDLVFFEVFSAYKTSLVFRLFRITFGVRAGYPAFLDTVAANLFETRTRAVDEDYRLNHLLGSILNVFAVLFRLDWFRVLFGLWLFSLLLFRIFRAFCVLGDYVAGRSR